MIGDLRTGDSDQFSGGSSGEVGGTSGSRRSAELERKSFDLAEKRALQGLSVANATADREAALSAAKIKRIEDEISAIENRRDAEIDAYRDSAAFAFATEREKAQKIAQINAQAQTEAQQREEKIRQEKRKSAEIDKWLKIAQMIITGAATVIEEYFKEGPAGAIAAGLVVGAQVALAAATPIPSFEVGTDDAPEGLAKVHKGELIIPKNGGKASYVDADTLMWLNRHDKVKTKADTEELMKYYALGFPALREGNVDRTGELLKGLDKNASIIAGAIRDKRFPSQRADPAWWQNYYNQHNR